MNLPSMIVDYINVFVMHLRCHRLEFQNVFTILEDFFVLANCADPVEMLHNAAFHLCLTVCQSTHLGCFPSNNCTL